MRSVSITEVFDCVVHQQQTGEAIVVAAVILFSSPLTSLDGFAGVFEPLQLHRRGAFDVLYRARHLAVESNGQRAGLAGAAPQLLDRPTDAASIAHPRASSKLW